MKQGKLLLTFYIFMSIVLLTGCIFQREMPTTPTTTSFPATSTPTSLHPTKTDFPLSPQLQLTYTIDSDIYSVDIGCLNISQPCLGKPQRLFKVGSNPILFYSWSPDGRRLTYQYENNTYSANWDGENKVKISSPSNLDTYWSVWTPDGQHIFYETKDENDYMVFMISDPDGRNQKIFAHQKELETKGDIFSPDMPMWSSNGKELVFQAAPSIGDYTVYQIFFYDLATDRFKKITSSDASNTNPSFSPDGQSIIFTRDPKKGASTTDGSLLVKASTQTNNETIIYSTAKDTKQWFWLPRWSPIGNWISFIMDDDIYIIRPDGTQLINVTQSSNIKENFSNWRVVFP